LVDLNELKHTSKNISKGVDVCEDDEITKENLETNGKIVTALAKEINTVIIASGIIDIISDGKSTYACENGDSMMPKITGSGCMLTSIVGSFCGVNEPFIGALAATIAMGIAGGEAGKFVREKNSGTGTFRVKLIDYLSNMDDELLLKEAKLYEINID
jgi:hydroxyethylthiazole kinase